jgi:prepilin-type processing-associated H-X9-DG protein
LEQKPLHDSLGVTKGNLWEIISNTTDPNYRAYVEQPLKILMCPSDTGYDGAGQVVPARDFDNGTGAQMKGWTQFQPGVSNYMGNFGHRSILSSTAMPPTVMQQNTGIFWRNSRVNSASVIDGLSNTVAVGERESRNGRSGAWVGVMNPRGGGQRAATLIVGTSRVKQNQPEGTAAPFRWQDNQGCGSGFTSLHPNGAQYVFCDGSVHFLTDSIGFQWVGNGLAANEDPQNGLYQRLLSRNDELPLIGEY